LSGLHTSCALNACDAILQDVFQQQLPQQWVDQLAAAVASAPNGYTCGASVVTNRLASPDAAPALAIIGDAAHATSQRLGLGVQAAVESAVALGAALSTAEHLPAALKDLNTRRQKEATALASVDRLVRLTIS
jgi:2-polyprenyl-6-methoxyphenol hydroxylase-like FAD-dependent oxidoreductase